MTSTTQQSATGPLRRWWSYVLARVPVGLALVGVAAVWVLGCVWSFAEQREFARADGFTTPELLPLVIDGFAASVAVVAYAAALDGRPAVAARVGTTLAVVLSAGSNGVWAGERSSHDPATIALAVIVPIVANIAFEVLLGEMRRRVQRTRGLPAPVAVPAPRMIRLVLAPVDTFTAWRRHVLELTAPDAAAQAGESGPTGAVPAAGQDDPQDGDPRPDPPGPSCLGDRDPSRPDPTVPPFSRDGLVGRPGLYGRRPVLAAIRDGHETVLPAVPECRPAPAPDGAAAVPPQLTGQDGGEDGDRDEPDRPTDDELLAVMAGWDSIPGIWTICNRLSIGKPRAGRLQERARDGRTTSQDGAAGRDTPTVPTTA